MDHPSLRFATQVVLSVSRMGLRDELPLYLHCASRGFGGEWFRLSPTAVARELQCGRKTVYRHLGALMAAGLLIREGGLYQVRVDSVVPAGELSASGTPHLHLLMRDA